MIWRKTAVLFLVIVMFAATACVAPSRKPLAIDTVKEKLDALEIEEYLSRDEFVEALDNERAMEEWLYLICDDQDLPKLFKNDKLNSSFETIPDYYNEMLSPAVERALIILYRTQGQDGAVREISILLFEFQEDGYAHDDYLGSRKEFFEHLWDGDTRKTCSATDDQQNGIDSTFYNSCWRRNAMTNAVYSQGNNILIMTAHEHKDNGIDKDLNYICNTIGIVAPDMSGFDTNESPEPDKRVDVLQSELCAAELDPSDFELKWQVDVPGSFYVSGDDVDSTLKAVDADKAYLYDGAEHYEVVFTVDDRDGETRSTKYVVLKVEFEDEDHAASFYDALNDEVMNRSKHTVSIVDVFERNGIRGSQYNIEDPYMSSFYSVYQEGRHGYILSFLNMDIKEAGARCREVTDIMGLT
ncbi:hypothetical protein SAMN02910456_00528 [Ruminococcaceae bacterium YRB3002]|nr:hypothetical protein SAMN02910456_00528 [Ruminococcaceae bacterium YRB3002]